MLAYLLSPRYVRHPYLLHTSLLVLVGRLITSDGVAPYLFLSPSPSSSSSDPFASSSPLDKSLRRSGSTSLSHAHMEASYEVLGSTTAGSVSGGSVSDSHSDGGAGSDEADAGAGAAGAAGGNATVNGEEVRASVEVFLKRQIARTVVSGMAFAMAVVGLWGDGARRVPVWHETIVVA